MLLLYLALHTGCRWFRGNWNAFFQFTNSSVFIVLVGSLLLNMQQYVSQCMFLAAWCSHETASAKRDFQHRTNKSISPRIFPRMLIFHADTVCYCPVLSFAGSYHTCHWWLATCRCRHDTHQHNWWESSTDRSDVDKRIPRISCGSYIWHLGKEYTWQSELFWSLLSHLQFLLTCTFYLSELVLVSTINCSTWHVIRDFVS